MNILNWFKPKNKRNVVLPSIEEGSLSGLDLIKAFTTEDEPKVAEFPRKFYKLYWEIFVENIPGGYGAVVKMYEVDTSKLVITQPFTNVTVPGLKADVNQFIRTTMNSNKR